MTCTIMYKAHPHGGDEKSLWEALMEAVTQVKDGRDLDSVGAVGKVRSDKSLGIFWRESQSFLTSVLIGK